MRIHFLQQWFGLSDPAMEEALHEVPLYREFSDMPLVSISNAQRAPLPWARWTATVLHGLPADLHPFSPQAAA